MHIQKSSPGLRTTQGPRPGIRLGFAAVLPRAYCVGLGELCLAPVGPLSPFLFCIVKAQKEISGSETGLQGTHGFHKEALGAPPTVEHELVGLQALAGLLTSTWDISIFIYSAY